MIGVGKFKRFDKDLYEANDKQCKDKIKEILQNSNFKVEENEKKMGVDLLVYSGDTHICNIEVERKMVWEKGFPFTTVNFPYRKKKFTGSDKKTLFVMFNRDFSSYLTVSEDDLIASPVNMVRNKYVRYGEQFYQVPVSIVKINKLANELKKMEKKNDSSK